MYRHIWAEINLDALEHNINEISKIVPTHKIMAVVKANAYGHGAGEVTKLLSAKGVKHFAVSNAYEAIDLASQGIDENILILGNVDSSAVGELGKTNITACLFDLECAKRLNSAATDAGVTLNCHIKLDTGMGRLGFNCRKDFNATDFENEITKVFALSNINITGVFTHFATADRDSDPNGEYAKEQYSRFLKAKNVINLLAKKNGINNLVFHSSNSAAALLDSKNCPSDLYRTGIILYGLTPSNGLKLPVELKPVMSLKAMVAQVKNINAGDFVSYGRTFKAEKPCTVATITAGYADGYMRGLSGKGEMIINGKSAPIIGRVCMDQTVVDITNIPYVKAGDVATLFGEGLPIELVANKLNTINYELVCAVAHRVPRLYLKQGKEINTIRYNSI